MDGKYQRSSKARGGVSRHGFPIIGVIVPDIENPFFSELAKAIEKEAYEQEYRILLCNSDDQKEKELANLQMLAQLQADGVILMTNTGEKSQSYEAVSMPERLHVFEGPKNCPAARSDTRDTGRYVVSIA